MHRASLVLLPTVFRRDFGEELEEAFTLAADDAHRRGGALVVAALLARALIDTVVTSLFSRDTLSAGVYAFAGATHPYSGRGGGGMFRTVLGDARVGLRMLARRPVYALVAIGTLALGIGANAALFSVVNAVVLRPLPYPQPDRLVRLYHHNSRSGNDRGAFSLPDREDWAQRTRSLEALGAYSTLPSGMLLTGGDEALEVRTAYVSSGFFEALGRPAYLGRTLRADEEYGDNRVVVLAYDFWQRRFGGDESIVGGTVTLDESGYRVVGVMPSDFAFPSADVEVYVFLSVIPASSIPLQIRQVRFLDVVGRMAEGVTLDQARQELSSVASGLVEAYPDENEELDAAALVPLRETVTAGVAPTLLILLGIVGIVLLIACANVASLLLSRGLERARELSIRLALGAGRGRLVRQLLTESALLGLAGGVAGLVLAVGGTELIVARSAGLIPRVGEIRVDGAVLAFAGVVTILTALGFGLLPAMRVSRMVGGEVGGGRLAGREGEGGGRGAARTWGLLVGGQVGLAVVVVIASGLLIRSVRALQTVDLGFEPEGLVALSVTIPDATYPERPQYLGMYAELMEGIDRLPSVEAVGSIRYLPLRQDGESTSFTIAGRPEVSGSDRPNARLLQVSPGFFEVAGVPILSGRDLGEADRADAPLVMVVNDALRRRYWPGEDPVGQQILVASTPVEVVGVVGDIRQAGLAEEPGPTIYIAQAQNPRRGMAIVARTAGDPEALLPEIRAAVRAIDPDQPIENLQTLPQVVRESAAQARFFSTLLTAFAALALILSSFGIYGVVNHAVSRKTSEIGIRVALGASRQGVLRMIVLGGMRPVVAGALAGLVVAFLASGTLRGILFGVSAVDPLTFVVVPLLLLVVAAGACWFPARRAVAGDPTKALRSE